MRDKFAIIGHHLSLDLLCKNKPEFQGKSLAEIKSSLAEFPPQRVTELNGVKSLTGKEIKGFGVIVNFLPEQYQELELKFVLDKIVSAIKLAKKMGAGIIVLGAANAIVGNQGLLVSKKVSGVAITTGNSYTAASVIEAVKEGAKLLNIALGQARVVIIGATGSIGSACSHVLSEMAESLVLVARNKHRLEELSETLSRKGKASISYGQEKDIKRVVSEADICITATSAPYALVDAKDFKSGALVCDVAVPRNVSLESGKLREDVLIIDSGLIKPPGNLQKSDFDIDVPAGEAPACLCEGMILLLENRLENYTLGKGISIEKVKEIHELGEKHGFELAAFRSFGKPLSKEFIKQVGRVAAK